MRSTVVLAVTIATAVTVAMAVTACGVPGTVGPLVKEHHDVERGAATAAKVDIEMSAGDLDVASGAAKLFEGDFDYNVSVLKPAIAYAVSGATGTLKVTQQSTSGSYENRWRLRLDDKTPIDLTVSLGAGDVELIIGRLNLRSLAVRLGAGDLKLDLRGTPANSYSVTVQAGAGDTSIQLPAGVGVSASTTGLIGDSQVTGLEKKDGRWINPRAEGAAVTIDVSVQHAVGDLKLSAD